MADEPGTGVDPAERWARVSSILSRALDLPEGQRDGFLADALAGEPALRAEVLALFEEMRRTGGFLEQPVDVSRVDAFVAAYREAGSLGDAPTLPAAEEAHRLEPGAALGPYRIDAFLGSGGMGEVYRAHDPRLDRDVAVKVLRARSESDPDLKRRLEREAKALARLSHPHICPVFDVGQQDGVDYLVMEYLEGETLAARLARGALSLDQALRLAVDVADALDKAHREGIVHRDLKPGNIMLTKRGARLLDFGLAKRRPVSVAGAAVAPASGPETGQGRIVGTLAYMAPEQLQGEEADARSDVFAFGAVLYEMVSGRKAFAGKTPASTIAAILDSEPAPVSTFQPMSPPALDHLVRTCLAKDREQRWQSAGDLGRQLAWLVGNTSASGARWLAEPGPKGRWWRSLWPLSASAALGGLSVGLGAWLLSPAPARDPRPVIRLDYELPAGHEFRNADRPVMAFSSDGSQFVYNTTGGLYVRSLREPEARLIPGTEEDLSAPAFSPDGRWVAYFATGELKKIAVSGGTPVHLCEAEKPFGMHWGTDETIVFGQANGVMRVPAAGGTPVLVVRAAPGEQLDGPQIMPGGEWILLTVTRAVDGGRWDAAEVAAQSLRPAGERKVLWTGGSGAQYVPTGHLLYAVKDTLFAAGFDAQTMSVLGRPVPLVRRIQRAPRPDIHSGFASYGVSTTGTLVYVRAEDVGRDRVLGLVDRQGAVERLNIPPGPYVNPRLSPDGSRLLVQTLDDDGRADVWIYELSGKRQIRQLTMGGSSRYPIWTPDGRRVTFVSGRDESPRINWQAIDGSAAEPLTEARHGTWQRPDSWSAIGPTLVFRTAVRDEDTGIWTLVPGRDREPELFHDLPGSGQYEAEFSPDGRWLAYTSTETGRDEVYVQPFPATGARVRVTQQGGSFPIWSPDGRELVYRRSFDTGLNRSQGTRLYAVQIATENGVEFGPERTLAPRGFLVFNTYRDYDVTRDGRRFLVVLPDRPPAPPKIRVVQNWFEELKASVPAN